MDIQVSCGSCGRKLTLTVQAAAARPNCLYCGIAFSMDEAAKAAVRAETAAHSRGAVAERTLECPICGRRSSYQGAAPGSPQKCLYCGCAFAAPEADQPALPGSVAALKPPPEDWPAALAAAAAEFGLGDPFSPASGFAAPRGLPGSALRALAARRIRGHAEAAEARASARILRDAALWNGGASSPLPPDWTAGLLAGEVLASNTCSLADRPGGGATVWVQTGAHEETTRRRATMEEASAQGIIGMALTGNVDAPYVNRWGQAVETFTVQQYLQIDLGPLPNGSSLEFCHAWSTGERKDLEETHRSLVKAARAGLARRALAFACLKALYGSWLEAATARGLTKARLDWWWETLLPGAGPPPELSGLLAG